MTSFTTSLGCSKGINVYEIRKITIKNGANIYIDGILRLLSLSDEEWTDIFKEYYKKVSLSYYAWPGEQKEMRRLFILEK